MESVDSPPSKTLTWMVSRILPTYMRDPLAAFRYSRFYPTIDHTSKGTPKANALSAANFTRLSGHCSQLHVLQRQEFSCRLNLPSEVSLRTVERID